MAGDKEPQREAILLEVRAELDVPGETGRQARVFAIWLACLALAVALGSKVGAHIPMSEAGKPRAEQELARSRADKAKVALTVGLLLPALLTWGLTYRYRRGGGHARGIFVDVTGDGELRLWGRGYGSRLALEGAHVTERLVDVYAGRLGAWRQRRLRVRSTFRASTGVSEIEIATPAVRGDADRGLRVDGGEGDCVEIAREDYERLRSLVLTTSQTAVKEPPERLDESDASPAPSGPSEASS
jgi:hypothetical protein